MVTEMETKARKIEKRVFRKHYKRLLREKKKVEKALQLMTVKRKAAFSAGREALLDLARLKIKGGPHDLSRRLRDYLYNS